MLYTSVFFKGKFIKQNFKTKVLKKYILFIIITNIINARIYFINILLYRTNKIKKIYFVLRKKKS